MARQRWRIAVAAAALAALSVAASARPAAAAPVDDSVSGTITAARPDGAIAVGDVSVSPQGRLELTVTDTRDDDPGWSVLVTVTSPAPGPAVGWKPYVVSQTRPFADSDGTVYSQDVTAGPRVSSSAGIIDAVLGSAASGHGLGIAVLGADLITHGRGQARQTWSAMTITVTAV